MTFDIVLPCLDEAVALPRVLSGLPGNVRAIVVDNGSTDGSGEVARALGAEVVECPRKGYGAACHRGLAVSTADIVAFCDCDASIDLTAIGALVDIVASGRADLVIARRRSIEPGAWPLHARAANAVLAWQVRRRTGIALRDLGPVRVARRDALLSLELRDRRSGYPLETVLRAAAADWRIVNVDVAYRPRVGRSKVTGTMRGSAQAVRDMRAVFAQ